MNKYLSIALFTISLTAQPIVAQDISINRIETPKMQLKVFPITKSFLYSMSETISSNRKFLVVAYTLMPDVKKLKKAVSFLQKENISFEVLTKKLGNKERDYLYIDTNSSPNALTVIKHMEMIGMAVKVGKNLLPIDAIGSEAGSFFSRFKREDIFSDKVQDTYLIQKLQNLALECLKNNHLLESVVESYMNDLFGRDSIDITGEPKMIEDVENGRMEYAPAFVSEFGTTICNCTYDEVVPTAEYKNISFYNAFQHNHKRLFGESYTLKKALKKVSIKPLKLTTNNELLHYFNSSYLSDVYSEKELKYTTNSKGVTIFCVRGNDGVKLCKTKKEILNQISLQNKTLY